MNTGIHIGAIVDKASLEPLTEAIVRIMSTPADQKTIRAALALIGRHAETSNMTIQGCSVVGDAVHHHHSEAEPPSADETE